MQGTITVGNRLMNKRTGFYFGKKHFTNTHQTQPARSPSSPSWEKRVGWSRPLCHATRGRPLTDQQPGMRVHNVVKHNLFTFLDVRLHQCTHDVWWWHYNIFCRSINKCEFQSYKDLRETSGTVPLSCQSSARWWVGQTLLHTPRESSAFHLCDWPLCS